MARKNYTEAKSYTESWYQNASNRLVMTQGTLAGDIECDVCIIGAGFTGLSAGIELIQKGFSVCILEKNDINNASCVKNNGHILRGYAQSPSQMISKFGLTKTREFQNISLEGLALILDRIQQYRIECDLKFGHVTTALKSRHRKQFQKDIKAWKKLGQDDFQFFNKQQCQEIINTDQYVGGLFDPKGAQIHPLNYALGLAENFMKAGGKIYDHTPAMILRKKPTPYVETAQGHVNAKFVILAGRIDIAGFDILQTTRAPAISHLIATESIGKDAVNKLMAQRLAITDARHIPNYFHFTGDHRLIFGGGLHPPSPQQEDIDKILRQKMLAVFPSLRMTRVDHFWKSSVNLSAKNLPHIGRINPHIYFAHGFNGHGIVSTNILGKVLAEAVTGTMNRFDVFAKIPPPAEWIGGEAMKNPAFTLEKLWYNLKDLL